MKFNHRIVWIHGNCEETEIARHWFSNSFTRAAYIWFADIAQHATGWSPQLHRVRDTTVAGFHYAAGNGDVYELR